MMEAGCLEWALLIAIILRDSISVVRVAYTDCLTDIQHFKPALVPAKPSPRRPSPGSPR